MVPFAEILSEDEAFKTLSQWGLTDGLRIRKESMPEISIDDPMVLALQEEGGLSVEELVGRIVCFTRRSAYAGVSRFYRVIVSTPLFHLNVRKTDEGEPIFNALHRRYGAAVAASVRESR
jgi:DNA-directed RNA polymerase subunit H (RpoH/RPB5)